MHWLKPLRPFFNWCERFVIRKALCVIPVCQSLVDLAEQQGAERVFMLSDISLLSSNVEPDECDIKTLSGENSTVFMYIGNLETYQGIDLLLEGFARARDACDTISLVIIGGNAGTIQTYKDKAQLLGVADSVHFAGPNLCR